MEIYKKAAKLKLRFQTTKGNLSVEQLWDLNMSSIKVLIEGQHEVVKKLKKSDDLDLAFLEEGDKDVENIESLKFDILKDIYLTKKQERNEKLEDKAKQEKLEKLRELIAKKQDEELSNKSLEDLQKEYEALSKS